MPIGTFDVINGAQLANISYFNAEFIINFILIFAFYVIAMLIAYSFLEYKLYLKKHNLKMSWSEYLEEKNKNKENEIRSENNEK